MTDDNIDYEAWAVAMCDLLDRIEAAEDDTAQVWALCQSRFDIAKQHGLTVEITGKGTGTVQ